MGMSIDEMISFCEEEEQKHRIGCKRVDDASGYTRSKNKNIRTAVAIREEIHGNYYKQIADTMRKYQKIEELAEYHMLRFLPKERMSKFQKDTLEVLEDGNDD